jgi:small subunit ribosomal protein S4
VTLRTQDFISGRLQEIESMGRYTGPKARVNRRLGFQVFENAGAVRALERKEYPPGMAQRRKKTSIFGQALTEKQKIKYYYGFREQQLRKYFAKAKRLKGNTGEHLMLLCERRLDNVVRRAGFAKTRPQARQGIVHGHFLVNGRRVDRPSYQCNAGDVITIKNRPNLKTFYEETASGDQGCSWINFDKDDLKAIVTSLPTADDVSLPVDVGAVVAFLSR